MSKQQNKKIVCRSRGSAEGEARPLYTFMSQDFYIQKFNKGTSYFVTMNPYKKHKRFEKLQRLSCAFDVLRKYSPHFLIVKEINPDGTSHYHAICDQFDVEREPPKAMTFDVRRVGGEAAPVSFSEPCPDWEKEMISVKGSLEYDMSPHHHLYHTTVMFLKFIAEKQTPYFRSVKAKAKRIAKIIYRSSHVGRVVAYMAKALVEPVHFVDFIYYAPKVKKAPRRPMIGDRPTSINDVGKPSIGRRQLMKGGPDNV